MKNIDKDLYVVTTTERFGKEDYTEVERFSIRGTLEEVLECLKEEEILEECHILTNKETYKREGEGWVTFELPIDDGDWDDPTGRGVEVRKFNFAVKEIYPYKHKDNDSMCFFAKPIEDEHWERVEEFVGIYHDEEFIDTVSKALDAEEELKKLTQE